MRTVAMLLGLLSAGPVWAIDLSAVASHVATDLRSRVTAQSSTISNDPLVCLTYSKKDLHSPKYHAFACVVLDTTGDGIVLGGIQNKRGDLLCQLNGFYTGGCLTLTGCGTSATNC